MTAKEAIMRGNEGMDFRDVIDNLYDDVILMFMRDYTELKCKELLEIVAEKVKIEVAPEGLNKRSIDVYESYERGGHGEPNWCTKISVDKDSILNAVDLKEFIK